MSKGISTFKNVTTSLACLKSKGHEFVVRYYSSSDWKRIGPAEAQSIFQAGLKLAIVYEDGPAGSLSYKEKVAYFTPERGRAHGLRAYTYARDVMHQPAGSTIYFAVDFDVKQADIPGNINNYFKAVREVFEETSGNHPAYRIGVYGSGWVCQWLLDHTDFVRQTWLAESTGWGGYTGFKDWNLKQAVPTSDLCGLVGPGNDSEYEMNDSQGDYGGFDNGLGGHLGVKALASPRKAKGRMATAAMAAKSKPITAKGLFDFLKKKPSETHGEGSGDGPHGEPSAHAETYLNMWHGKRGADAFVKVIAIRGDYEPDEVNRIGIYDDRFLLCIGTQVTEWRGSTDPGQHFISHPINTHGCAQLVEGIHMFERGLHHQKYPAFVQGESFHVNRLNGAGEIVEVQFGDFAIHLHSGGEGMNVQNYSAGCQIIQCPEGYFGATWNRFYKAASDALDSAQQTLMPYMLVRADEA